MTLQFQGHRHDCARRPFEVRENESTACANVPHNMAVSSRPVPIMRGETCNPLARPLSAFQLAVSPMPQPLGQPLNRSPPGRLENPVHRQSLALHKLLAGCSLAEDCITAERRWEARLRLAVLLARMAQCARSADQRASASLDKQEAIVV